jgi:two-component system, NarL family, response regulator LiaR
MGATETREPVEQQWITVLIVDDQQLVRWGVRTFLATQADMSVVGEAASGEEALRMAASLAPDVALMDLIMPGMDGVETTRRLTLISPRTQVIVLTSYHEDEHIFPAIRAGALSYLLKDVSTDELAEAVRRAARGEAVMHPHVAARLVQELRASQRPKPAGAAETPSMLGMLSEREQEVLRLIADGRSNAEIAEQLVISEFTVKRHVSNILGKLHLADRTQAAVYAWREGMVERER